MKPKAQDKVRALEGGGRERMRRRDSLPVTHDLLEVVVSVVGSLTRRADGVAVGVMDALAATSGEALGTAVVDVPGRTSMVDGVRVPDTGRDVGTGVRPTSAVSGKGVRGEGGSDAEWSGDCASVGDSASSVGDCACSVGDGESVVGFPSSTETVLAIDNTTGMSATASLLGTSTVPSSSAIFGSVDGIPSRGGGG